MLEKFRTHTAKVVVTSMQEVGRILDYVHDRVFQLSAVRFDRERAALSIPLTIVADEVTDRKKHLFFRTWRNPVVNADLVIKHVIDFSIKDDAQIGKASINTIEIKDGMVVINCDPPVEILVKVLSAEVELQISDNVVNKIFRFAFASPFGQRGEGR